MKTLLILLSILFLAACSKPEPREFSDDYVLIEFASKLEENYHQLHPTTPTSENQTKMEQDSSK